MITLKASGANFFDRKIIIDAIGKARASVFTKFGSKVRKLAQTSIKMAKSPNAVSSPGSPPLGHATRKVKKGHDRKGNVRMRSVSLLREFIWFSYDKDAKSVVIGPERLNSTAHPESLAILEYGGTTTTEKRQVSKRVGQVGREAGTGRFTKAKTVLVQVGGTATHAARPFMTPAFNQAKSGLAELWTNSVRK